MSPRKRTKGPEWLPTRCYMGRVSYEYHPKSGGSVKLGLLTESKEIILAKYYSAVSLSEEPTGAFNQLMREYFAGSNYLKLSTRTKIDYVGYGNRVGLVFGKTNKHRIKPQHIRRYMDQRAKTTIVQANREHSFMSAVFSWAYENGKVKANPCKGVRKFTEPHRERYIEDWEYNAVLAEARIKWPLLFAAMEISYLCAARQADVWDAEKPDIRKEGLYIEQGKTGVKQIKEWTPRLRAAIDVALSVQKVSSLRYLFCDKKGNRPTQKTMAKWYAKARVQAREKYEAETNKEWITDFTFHDIKAKSMSDYEGEDLRHFSGHKTEAQAQSYNRKVKVTPTLKPKNSVYKTSTVY